VHRLAPQYVSDINSPLRHVRTRIYFTSESHIHALINILRFAEVDGVSLLSDEARAMLAQTTEFDYLTQIVFRMYEDKLVCSRPGVAEARSS
jgi:inositol-hexakisphosphate/diphosphoinositol-pentakisphosphate 1-kinase